MNSNLEGRYQTCKSNLVNSRYHFVIGSRKKPSIQKPKYYLLHRLSPTNFQYISSLYPLEGQETDQIFSFDWNGQQYTLTYLDGQQAEISPLRVQGGNSPISINNGELG